MADVFISHSKQDRAHALALAEHLKAQGWTTWCNDEADRTAITAEVDKARLVVVLWSVTSVASPFVVHQAIIARDAEKLLQVIIPGLHPERILSGLRGPTLLDANDLSTIEKAVAKLIGNADAHRSPVETTPPEAPPAGSEDPAQLPLPVMLEKRERLERLGGGDISRAEPVITGMRAPTTQASAPVPQGSPSTPLAKRSNTSLIAIAATGVAALAAAVVFRNGISDILANALESMGKLLAFLKLGTLAPIGPDSRLRRHAQIVDCSIFAPPSAPAGTSIFVQLFLHTADQFERAETIATKIDKGSQLRSIATLQTLVELGQRLAITFDCPELGSEASFREIVWRGHAQAVSFRVTLPKGTKDGQEFFPIVRVSIEGVPVGFLEFSIACREADVAEAAGTGNLARRYEYAFLSYASQDRTEVMKFARALKAARIDFFQDILSLEPGEEWEPRLFDEINRCDVFYLFWSQHAASSEMVKREAEHAYRRAAISASRVPDITPIRLDGSPLPTDPPHPPWMSKIHFDDYFRKLIQG